MDAFLRRDPSSLKAETIDTRLSDRHLADQLGDAARRLELARGDSTASSLSDAANQLLRRLGDQRPRR